MSDYYSLEPIESKVDLDGKKPSIYLISSNRSAGKTTAVLEKILKRYHTYGFHCVLLYRSQYEISASHLLFTEILQRKPEYGTEITTRSIAHGLMYQIMLDGEILGYSMSLYNPDPIKKYSPLFSKVETILMDEFQSESGRYLKHEIDKLQSIYISIARGGGKQHRDVDLYLLSNAVTIMNPYYIHFGIHKRIKQNTKFIRGYGWICEFNYNESAANAISGGVLARAFDTKMMKYAMSNVYLNDDMMFCQPPTGKSIYICTLRIDGKSFGIREYFEDGFIYATSKIDPNHKRIFTFKADDHNQTTIMLSHASDTWKYIRKSYDSGFLRFDGVETKNAIYDILAIDSY